MNIEKKKRGGLRPGAGRKPKLLDENARYAIQKALRQDPEQLVRIWKTIMDKAEKGSDRHAQILFNYYHGKPVETVNVTSKELKVNLIVVQE